LTLNWRPVSAWGAKRKQLRKVTVGRLAVWADTGVGLLLSPWQSGHKDHFVRIVPTSITGQVLHRHSPSYLVELPNQALRAGMG
jgi:hypothetical protein